jgi:thiamine-phosphate pyrophosphorylase
MVTTRASRSLPRLLGLTPGVTASAAEGALLARRVAAAVEGGLTGLVLREPLLPDGPYLELARLCRQRVAWLALHDRPHLVAAAGADAVHLGFRSLTPGEARTLVAPDVAIGFSGHVGDPPGLLADADYSTFGPVYPTASKRGVLPDTGLAPLAERCSLAGHPVFALGGVTAQQVDACTAHGAYGVAVIGALFERPGAGALQGSEASARARALCAALAAPGPSATGGAR